MKMADIHVQLSNFVFYSVAVLQTRSICYLQLIKSTPLKEPKFLNSIYTLNAVTCRLKTINIRASLPRPVPMKMLKKFAYLRTKIKGVLLIRFPDYVWCFEVFVWECLAKTARFVDAVRTCSSITILLQLTLPFLYVSFWSKINDCACSSTLIT